MSKEIRFMLVIVLSSIIMCLSGLGCLIGDNGENTITPKQKTQIAKDWPTVIWPTSTPIRYD